MERKSVLNIKRISLIIFILMIGFASHAQEQYKINGEDLLLFIEEDGKITEIESSQGIPKSALPEEIVTYVKANYPNVNIVEWEKEAYGQEIELSNGLELKFNFKNEFIGYD